SFSESGSKSDGCQIFSTGIRYFWTKSLMFFSRNCITSRRTFFIDITIVFCLIAKACFTLFLTELRYVFSQKFPQNCTRLFSLPGEYTLTNWLLTPTETFRI